MSALVVERSVAAWALPGSRPMQVVPRRRRRGRWLDLDADAVIEAIDAAGHDPIVLARPAADDPGASCLPALGVLLGAAHVRLPGDPARAGWVVSVATQPSFGDGSSLRRLEALVGAAAGGASLPGRGTDEVRGVPAVRPGVLARWAGCAWRPCARCGGGGLPGAACARCGAPRGEVIA